jgi:hypothetical protein
MSLPIVLRDAELKPYDGRHQLTGACRRYTNYDC